MSFILREGIRQAEMLAFPFAAAREPAKLAGRVLTGLLFRHLKSLLLFKTFYDLLLANFGRVVI